MVNKKKQRKKEKENTAKNGVQGNLVLSKKNQRKLQIRKEKERFLRIACANFTDIANRVPRNV